MLLLLEPSNVVLVVSWYSVVGWLGGGCECYACGDGVEVANDERCDVSMQAISRWEVEQGP